MYRVIGGDNKQYGPVTADELRRWIVEGRLSRQSLVQVEGSGEWKPLTSLPEFMEALRAQAGGPVAGGAVVPPSSPAVWSAQILASRPDVQIGRCLSRSWELFISNFGLLFGAT